MTQLQVEQRALEQSLGFEYEVITVEIYKGDP